MEQISSDRFPPLSSQYPWLIAQSIEDEKHNNTQDQFFCTMHHELPHYRCQIPELLGKRIRGFFHGWVILSNHPYNNIWSLWNQVTSKVISLPTLVLEDGEYESIHQCCLSAPPDDPNSILLLTTTNKSIFLFCPIDSKREDFRWAEMPYAQQLKRLTKNGKLLHSLTCCNGKVYALCTDGTLDDFVICLDIVVKYNEVVINLMLFNLCPLDPCGNGDIKYLKGSSTELFFIEIAFGKGTENIENKPARVNLFKLDMTCINREEMELYIICNDIEDSNSEDLKRNSEESYKSSEIISCEAWKVIDDLKAAILFIDVARDHSVSYSPVVVSDLGGFIHIRGEMGKTIYSYSVKDKTISLSSIPSPMLPTSHVSVWECRLEDDHGEAKCIVDYKGEMGNNDQKILLRSSTDDGLEFKNSHLLNIPFDLLEMIMELSVGVEYMNFRATCKQCLIAAPLIKWSNETSLRKLQTHSPVSPWLMVVDNKRGIITFTDPLLGDKYFLKNSQVLTDEDRICYSKFGWLLIKNRDLTRLALFNPFTNDFRELKDPKHNLGGLCFSAPPTSLDCMVVGFTTEHIYIYYVNQKRRWNVGRLGKIFPHGVCFSGFIGRDLYVFFEGGELFVTNNIGSNGCVGELFEAKAPEGYCRSATQYFITNCDQHCLLVSVGEYGEAVEVFKLNDTEKKWGKIDSIGNHAIYISGTACFCIEAEAPKMGNKIFFARLHTKNKRVVFYSLDTCRYHTFDAQNFQEHLEDFFGTTHHLSHNVWIEPSWS